MPILISKQTSDEIVSLSLRLIEILTEIPDNCKLRKIANKSLGKLYIEIRYNWCHDGTKEELKFPA